MSDFSLFKVPFPWDPEWQVELEKMRKQTALEARKKREADYYIHQIVEAMTCLPKQRRGRGRPKVQRSVDFERALLVLEAQAFLAERGLWPTRSRIIKSFQQRAAKPDPCSFDRSLFPVGDLTSSVSRGMREIKEATAADESLKRSE